MDVLLKDGVSLAVKNELDNATSWATLEQEDWFENEMPFLRVACRPDWHVLDVGANHGVYSLALAKAGAAKIWAFEPTIEPLTRFRRSIEINGFQQKITPLHLGLSDKTGQAQIHLGWMTELNSLFDTGNSGVTETIELTTLDQFSTDHLTPGQQIDFMKLDAEGEEIAILQGGKQFFTQQSPLVMFELKHGQTVNVGLIEAFEAYGYGIYVLVPGLNGLRPFSPVEYETHDAFVLNLFACKPDRAERLKVEGVLLTASDIETAPPPLQHSWLSWLWELPMVATELRNAWAAFDLEGDYGRALIAWCGSRNQDLSLQARFALLQLARQSLTAALTAGDSHPAVSILLIRVLFDAAERIAALNLADVILTRLEPEDIPLDRPLPPGFDLFDTRSPRTPVAHFIFQSVLEFKALRAVFSSLYAESSSEYIFERGLESDERSPEFERRAVLLSSRIDFRLKPQALFHLFDEANPNADFWIPFAKKWGFYAQLSGAVLEDLLGRIDADVAANSFDELLVTCRRAVDCAPESAEAHFRLGTVLYRLERYDDASASLERALKLKPDTREVENQLGLSLSRALRFGEAEGVFRKSLEKNPECPELHRNLAKLLSDTSRSVEAIYYMLQAKRLLPDSAEVMDQLGSVYLGIGRYREALAALEEAVKMQPEFGTAWMNLGRACYCLGKIERADVCYAKALELVPDYMAAWTNRLMICNYRPRDQHEVFAIHKSFGDKLRQLFAVPEIGSYRQSFDKDRRLRVGFVSGDFRRHSVGYFVEGVLQHLDPQQFRLYSYFTADPDARTQHFKQYFSHWQDVKWMSAEKLAERILYDQIDVLIDLSGHTTANRIPVFARKPAPIQVSWIGYPNTTGLWTMDYRITDALADVPGEADAFHTEKLWRLPGCFLNYTPSEDAPEVEDSPVLERSYITFGSFNNQPKLGNETFELWAAVLAACPDSRLIIKTVAGYVEPSEQKELKSFFAERGVAPERIDIRKAELGYDDHMAIYHEVDIGLDAFPYNGTTTTFEALWMGVPVVTLAGDRHVSRVGLTILTNAGLPGLVAHSPEEFVEIASGLATDPVQLQELRQSMRDRLKSSVLLDAEGMGWRFGAALREMWSGFCESAVDVVRQPPAQLPYRNHLLRLNIGGTQAKAGWRILSMAPGADFKEDIRDLSRMPSETCREIYCSYVLQQLGQGDVLFVLNDLMRLLVPGGSLFLSVPDMDTLAWLFNSPVMERSEHFRIMRLMFGEQATPADFNCVGLNEGFMRSYLNDVGVASIERVVSFGIFDDKSNLKIGDTPISLNLVIKK